MHVKHSHSDYYKDDGETKKSVEDLSLIGAKFLELSATIEKVGAERAEYLRLSNQPYSKWQAIFNLE
jgi:hypothetical protein